MADKYARGRARHVGNAIGSEVVEEIRGLFKDGVPRYKIATQLGLSVQTVRAYCVPVQPE